jgi:hypothetical protein
MIDWFGLQNCVGFKIADAHGSDIASSQLPWYLTRLPGSINSAPLHAQTHLHMHVKRCLS